MEDSDIYAIIESNLPLNYEKKSQNGEVFTPVSLIEMMYDKFPSSVWSDPRRKWLDPAAGVGNFALVLFVRLMKGLQRGMPSPTKRAKHIIENMIFMVEIDKENARICRGIFKRLCPDAIPNLHLGDFLTSAAWPTTAFDCIVGNPPYNIGGKGRAGLKRTHILFTQHSLACLVDKGYLAFICPPSYREAGSVMNRLFTSAVVDEDAATPGHFVFIKIYGADETFRIFRIKARVDAFLFQKSAHGNTDIDDEYGIIHPNIRLNLQRHVPNFGYSIFDKLVKKIEKLGGTTVNAFRSTELSSLKSSTFGCRGKNKILHLIIESGRRVFKTGKKHSLANEPKLLVNGLGIPYVFYDKEGEYGFTQCPMVVLRPSPAVVHFMQSDFFSFLAWGLRLTGNNNLPYIFDYVPDLGKSDTYKTMDDIRRGLGLTAAEVAFVETHFHRYYFEDVDRAESCVAARGTRKKSK